MTRSALESSAVDGVASLPPRVWVVGPVGSGKSTFADRLARVLGVEPTHLDDLHWQPGWVPRSPGAFCTLLAPVVARPSWVIDGNYLRAQQDFINRADLVVWLDLPLATTFRRILVRSFRRSAFRIPCCNGNYEDAWGTLAGKDSILAWSISKHWGLRRRFTTGLAGRPHVRFRDERRLSAWLKRIESSAALSVGARV